MIDNVKIGRVLGTGKFGIVHLCTYKGKKYAIKTQILTGMRNMKLHTSFDLWKEIEAYKYVEKMPPSVQVFFNRLYEYKVYHNIGKIGTNIGDSKSKWEKNAKILYSAGWGIKYLLEYKGNTTFYNYLTKNRSRLTPPQLYSFCLQILYIITILKKGGYVNDDSHFNNIMVTKTTKEYFIFNGKQIKYYGIQLSLIDYGYIVNKKHVTKYKDDYRFIEGHQINMILRAFDNILTDYFDVLTICENKDETWNTVETYDFGLKQLFIHNLKFCNKIISKYLKIYPEAKKDIKSTYKLYKTDTYLYTGYGANVMYYYFIINRLIRNFYITYPKLYMKYFKWCRDIKIMLPKAECLEIYSMTDLKSITKWFLNKV